MSENNNQERSVSLSDLSNGAIPTATPVGMPNTNQTPLPKFNSDTAKDLNRREAVLPSEDELPVENFGNPVIDNAFANIDNTINRIQAETDSIYQKGLEERVEQAVDDENIDDDVIKKNTSNTLIVHNFDDDDNKHIPPIPSIDITEPITDIEYEPVSIKKEVLDVKTSAPVSGTETKTISMVPEEAYNNVPEKNNDDSLFDIDEEDLHFLDDDEDEEKNTTDTESFNEEDEENKKTEKIKENIRTEMNKNFKPVDNKIDFKKFTIAKKPISASKIITNINKRPIECADGVLYSVKRAIRMSAFEPMEIQSLDPDRLRQGNYNSFMKNKLNLIYEHLVDENKPKSFESWAKITPNTTVDDYMFTAYKATFGLSNIITFTCNDDKCNNVFLETVPVNNMIKFKDDTVREEYMNILHSGNTNSTVDTYDVVLYQASDEYVFGLKIPSLYNTFIEPTLVDQKFMKKYEDLILLLSYIDCVYIIDRETSQLIPVDTKPVPNNDTMTYKRKVKTFASIIKSLTSDQLQALSVETDKYDAGKLDDNGKLIKPVTYVYPERKCPKCGKKIDEIEIAPDSMLFTRHQLGLMNKI